jgi:hypothetical protein
MACKTQKGLINKVYIGDGRKNPLKDLVSKKKKRLKK